MEEGGTLCFLNAVLNLGLWELGRNLGDDEFADIDSFIQLPMEIIEPKDGADKKVTRLPGKEIRVYLDVDDSQSDSLRIKGVKKIVPANYFGGSGDERARKRRYLYRDPVGSAAMWRFSPLYKLGKGVKDGRKELCGGARNWREYCDLRDMDDKGDDKNKQLKKQFKECRLFKLESSTLRAFEERGVFSPGSVDVIMEYLVEHADELAELWTESKSSHMMIISPCDGDKFLYPIDVKSYLAHFRARRQEQASSPKIAQRSEGGHKVVCALCHENDSSGINLDEIFAFATFDKESFLPGLDGNAKSKVFTICDDCNKSMSEGRNLIDKKFLDERSISNVKIYVIPELLLQKNAKMLKNAVTHTADFIKNGLCKERFLSERVTENEDEIVLHFVFWEKNQAQERLLLMVEDVPPSRLKLLEKMWGLAVNAATAPYGDNRDDGRPLSVGEDNERNDDDNASSSGDKRGADGFAASDDVKLKQAIDSIRIVITALSGKQKDEKAPRELMLDIIGRLLRGDPIDIEAIKAFVVSRLQGLFSDGEWAAKYGRSNMRKLQCVVDFLYRANER
jgi:CRISPR-associated protein Csh1